MAKQPKPTAVVAPPSPALTEQQDSLDRRGQIKALRGKNGRNTADNSALLNLLVDELVDLNLPVPPA